MMEKQMNDKDPQSKVSNLIDSIKLLWAHVAAAIMLIIYVVMVFSYNFNPGDEIFSTFRSTLYSLFQGAIPSILATYIVFISSFYVLKKYNMLGSNIIIDGIKKSISDSVNSGIERHKLNGEIERVYYDFLKVDWDYLLNEATSCTLCIFYVNKSWMDKNKQALIYFLRNGGLLTIYLPDPSKISGRFFGVSEIPSPIRRKVFLSYRMLDGELRKLYPDTVRIEFSGNGFNFMFAYAEQKQGSLTMISPYPNTEIYSPSIIINNKAAPKEFDSFINAELISLKNHLANKLYDFEEKRYIVWDTSKDRVFISSDLKCNVRCKFCFVESVVSKEYDHLSEEMGEYVALSIAIDPRTRAGRQGTAFMLGGHMDPFQAIHFKFFVKFIQTIQKDFPDNMFHIATRVPLSTVNIREIQKFKEKIVVNISISSLGEGVSIEVKNQNSRFSLAKELIDMDFKVSLYIRPVIKGITLRDMPKIIDLAKKSGITTVTLGGLYFDDRIIQSLDSANISLQPEDIISDKAHVLDVSHKLKKLRNEEIEEIRDMLDRSGLIVFNNAQERVAYYAR